MRRMIKGVLKNLHQRKEESQLQVKMLKLLLTKDLLNKVEWELLKLNLEVQELKKK